MIPQSSKHLKIFFHSAEAIGHLNGCIGLAQALAQRGHKIHFLMTEDFKGKLTPYGFEEILLKKPGLSPGPPPSSESSEPRNPLKEFAQGLLAAGILGPKSPYEKMRNQLEEKEDMMGKMAVATGIAIDPQIEAAIERIQPDVIVIDSFSIPPAVQKAAISSNIPWVFLCSAQPICLFPSKGKLPPFGAGFATNSSPDTWTEFDRVWKLYRYEKFCKYQNQLEETLNFAPKIPLDNGETLFYNSPYLNIYGYPEELDYQDVYSIPDNFIRVDSLMRKVVEPEFELPNSLKSRNSGQKLIYVSLGTLGSIDVDLMTRVTSVLGKTSHKYIVSKGQRGDEYELPENCWGQNFLPQTRILPLVDLVITHGGNNTVCESLHYGKPLIILPLMGDQFDSAQRVEEKGFGIRLSPYKFTDAQLIDSINRLLKDRSLNDRLSLVKLRIQNSSSKTEACERIERLVERVSKHLYKY